ncbi:MAG: glycoside hydrolase family 2 TIM barrel-domain containing protein [Eubacteriales bacterium]|nr:glycoside hydrolase family 2 TIM barrel-domain containing protein [Eubacteriales bacterium]
MIRQNLNRKWEFKKGKSSLMAAMTGGAAQVNYVNLPHDAMIHETPFKDAVSGAQTGFYPGGGYTYTKTLSVPQEWAGKEVFIEFEGVYQTAMVYVNGDFAGNNLHGYGEFIVPVHKYLHFGADNEIKVIANNPDPNSRWYSGSGIYRSVNLMVGGDVHIVPNGVRFTTKDADAQAAVVEVETKIVSIVRERRTVEVHTQIGFGGETVKEDTIELTVWPGESETVRCNLLIEDPQLWDCDCPNLYDVKVEIVENGIVLDAEEFKTGIRTITLDAQRGFRLNGRETKMAGTCIHHDNGVIGAATFAAAEEKRAREMRAAGFNAIRSAHHPMSRAMLEACDKYGLLVMDELSDVWYHHKNPNDFAVNYDACWESEAEKMVAKDYNHPCVVLYSIGNEIIDLGKETGGRLSRKIANKFRALDPTRFTTAGINGMMNAMGFGYIQTIVADILKAQGIDPAAMAGGEGGVAGMNMMMTLLNSNEFASHPLMTKALEQSGQALDVAGYNYLTGRHEMEAQLHPNKPIVGSETFPADIVRLWRIVEDNHHVLGDFTWTGYDYLGEAGCGIFYYDGTVNFSSHFPDRLAYIGDIDIIGNRKPISYLREIVYGLRKEPYIGVIRMNRYGQASSRTAWMFKDNIASWTWPGFEGKETEVDIYSADPEVELFINGVSQGKKPAGRENGFTATYTVAYQPGEIVAVGYDAAGAETSRFCLKTAGEQVLLHASADKMELAAGGQDLAFVTVRLTDENGAPNRFVQKKVHVCVEGAGTLQGFGSADPQPLASYDAEEWDTYDGEVMAVVRSGDEAGKLTVRFSAEGCEDAPVELSVR